jgi:hypothetical protein
MAPMEDQGGRSAQPVITREQASLELTDGPPGAPHADRGAGGGRRLGGHRAFPMNVDHPGEQQRLKRFFGSTSLDIPITSIVFFFRLDRRRARVETQAGDDRRVG